MKRNLASKKKKAVAGIVAAIILFAMLFTVGTTFFLFTNSTNQQYIQSLVSRVNSLNTVGGETLLVTTLLSSASHVEFYVNNTGGVNANITTVLLYSTTGTPLQCVGKGLPASVCTAQSATFSVCANSSCSSFVSPAPSYVVDNVGKGTSVIDTGYTYSSGTVTVKIITARGAAFSQTYPITSLNNPVSNALNAGAIGDLYLTFTSYKMWTVTTSGCSSAGDYSGYCLSTPTSAFSVGANFQCSGTTYCSVFSVRVTDLNQQHASIQLSQFSIFYQLYPAGANGKAGYLPWYIISNSTIYLYNHFHVINLTYNQPQTLIFGAASCLSANSGPNLAPCTSTLSGGGWFQQEGSSCNKYPSAPTEPCGQIGVSFINPNGWELASISATRNLAYSTMNYAQNLAFISTLYN